MAERDVGTPVTCARHHNVETLLRCSRCNTPICPKCLVHTPVGARCPDCAKPVRGFGGRDSLVLYITSGATGLAVALVAGALLSFIGLGALTLIPVLLTGFLVGEAVSNVGRRRPDRVLAVIAFVCASIGPSLGSAIVIALTVPVASPEVRAALALTAAISRIGLFGILMAIVAGAIASSRVR